MFKAAILLAGTTLVACSLTGSSSSSSPAAKQNRGQSATKLYIENCAKCHGQDGQGGGAGTPSFNTLEKFDQKYDKPFFDAIKHGVKDAGMDAYGETMSDAEIWSLVVHMREIQHRELRKTGMGTVKKGAGFTSKHHDYRIEDVVKTGLRTPWAIDWLADGQMLVTNRGGILNIVSKTGSLIDVEGTPEVIELGQGGLMDVAVHPSGWVYLGFTEPGQKERTGMTKIVRGKIVQTGATAKWTAEQVIFKLPEDTFTGSGVHFGNRIVFDGKGHVFFAIGERGNQNLSQDLSKPNGKIYRLMEDGKVPKDNPFVGKSGAIPAIWSYGHRNPQGLVFDLNGVLWDTEHAPRGGDELNIVEKGANYGWPIVSHGINYNDSPTVTPWPSKDQNIKSPVFRWLPSTGACGLDVVKGAAFPKWKGDLLAGGLAGQNVDRIRVKDGVMTEREEIVLNIGRVRDVQVAKDGTIYVALNGPDKIVRVVPTK